MRANVVLRGNVVPVVDIDVTSAYPAASSLLGCTDILGASEVREVDATDELGTLAAAVAAGDMTALFDPTTYRRLGLSLAEVLFDGEHGPVELTGDPSQRSSFHIAPLYSDVPLPVTGWDVILSALLSHRVPKILSATRIEPVGTEQGGHPQRTRPFPLRDGLLIERSADPIAAGVRVRQAAKDAADECLPVQLRVFLNSMAWGVFARLDQSRVPDGRGRPRKLIEKPATWTWPPIASSVPAVTRMWLAMIDREVSDAGGTILTRDTDGVAIVALPTGGPVTLADGTTVRALSWEQIDELVARFDALNPFGDGRAFWKVDRGTEKQPLHILSLGQKRYVKAHRVGGRWEAIGGTEHALGGGVIDPSALAGRDAERRHHWTFPVAQHALARATAAAEGQPGARFEAPWDSAGEPSCPVLRNAAAVSPTSLEQLPKALGAHAFAPVIEAHPDGLLAAHAATPMTLDPGTDLAESETLQWLDHHGATKVTTTAGSDVYVVPLQTLREFSEHWAEGVAPKDPGAIHVDARLIRRVGRGGAVIDAQLAGATGDLSEYEVVYDEGDAAGFVLGELARLKPAAFSRRFDIPLDTAKKLSSSGRQPDPATIRAVLTGLQTAAPSQTCALDGCDEPVTRAGKKFHLPRCRKIAGARSYRLRQRAKIAEAAPAKTRQRKSRAKGEPSVLHDGLAAAALCGCGVPLLGGAVERGTCWDCDKAAVA
jgi:hypothetical protein